MSAVYLVNTQTGQKLVKATNRHVAINFAVKKEVTAKSVTASELVELMQAGLQIEDATPKRTDKNQTKIEGV
jgi:hypothetical protein